MDYLNSLPVAAFDGARDVTIPIRRQPTTMSGQAYLLTFALPNFFFHVTTAYDILRHKGVGVGKMDYLGKFELGMQRAAFPAEMAGLVPAISAPRAVGIEIPGTRPGMTVSGRWLQ